MKLSDYYSDVSEIPDYYKPHEKRRIRLDIAKRKGTHTRQESIELLKFFNYTCVCCFRRGHTIGLSIDHIVPLYLGGSDSIKNLQPLCTKCNSSKGDDATDMRHFAAKMLNLTLPEQYAGAY